MRDGDVQYQRPSEEYTKRRTGLNRWIEGYREHDIDEKLRLLILDIEPEVEANVGTELWTSTTLTGAQTVQLKRAVAYRTAAAYLLSPATEKLTGTQEPLLMEDAGEIRDFIDWLEEKAAAFEKDALTGGDGATPVPEDVVFALPYVRSSTYAPSSSPSPSERIAARDVREDREAGVA
jgi:hypothetical protein